jgi:hypothetical protein
MSAPHKDRVITVYIGEGMKAKIQAHCDAAKPRPMRVSTFVNGLIVKELKRAEIRAELKAR